MTQIVSTAETEFQTAQKSLVEICADKEEEKLKRDLQIMDGHIKSGSAVIAAFGVLLLLKNKAIHLQNQKGKACAGSWRASPRLSRRRTTMWGRVCWTAWPPYSRTRRSPWLDKPPRQCWRFWQGTLPSIAFAVRGRQ